MNPNNDALQCADNPSLDNGLRNGDSEGVDAYEPAHLLTYSSFTTRPAYSMPAGHHHPNGPNTRVNAHSYVTHSHMHI